MQRRSLLGLAAMCVCVAISAGGAFVDDHPTSALASFTPPGDDELVTLVQLPCTTATSLA